MDQSTRAAEGLRFGCPGCGSGLRYDIESGRMRCDNCGQSHDLADIPDPSRQASDGFMDAAEYRCPQCGAAVHTTQTSAASFCSYCGADVILTQRLTRVMRPQRIVPFRVTREQCEKIYRDRVRAAKYAPEDFSSQETIGHFRPVYVPFWQYKGAAALENVQGSAVHHHSDSRYDYTDTYGYDVSGDVKLSDVIYDASLAFEDETARRLNFSSRSARPFHPGYLCGFYAESPDTPPTLFEENARDLARGKWSQTFAQTVKLSKAEIKFSGQNLNVSEELELMPVWLLAHRSGGRVVYTAINGDTGEIVCDTPVSNRRFGVLALEMTCLIAAALLLLQFVLLLRPRLLAAVCGVIAALAQWAVGRLAQDLRIRAHREDDLSWMLVHGDQHGVKRKKVKKVDASLRWYIPALIVGGVTVVGMIVAWMALDQSFNAFVASLVSDHAWLPVALQGAALAVFLAAGFSRQGPVDDGLYFLRLAALIVTLAAIFLAAADLPFYLCCFAQLVFTALAMVRINRTYNVFVSRPVPFFGKEGEEA